MQKGIIILKKNILYIKKKDKKIREKISIQQKMDNVKNAREFYEMRHNFYKYLKFFFFCVVGDGDGDPQRFSNKI